MKGELNSVELFSGAGGLALGLADAGFHHELLLEWNADACKTLNYNKSIGFNPVKRWNIIEGDAKNFDFKKITNAIDLVAGGPPCQPFSLGGKHKGPDDHRDLFPVAINAVRELKPKAFVFENVKGLLRGSFVNYLQYITFQLSYPNVTRNDNETNESHFSRLERVHTQNTSTSFGYKLVIRLLNAADYGVPQKRERVFIVGFRNDLHTQWSFPEPTHSQDALLWSKWVTGEYWNEHKIFGSAIPKLTSQQTRAIESLKSKYGMFGPDTLRWRTVRDAISFIPKSLKNHEIKMGAKTYPGHTGSEFDEPAKTLKAGDHGVPGGENMCRYNNEHVRYFSVRESARIQTFPDNYILHGSWTEGMRQLGNAVPVKLAEAVGKSIARQLKTCATTH